MTNTPKAALIAALMISVGGVAVSAPALAKKKEEAPTAAPKLSQAFIKPAADAQAKIKAMDWAGAETALASADAVASTDDEKYTAATLRLTLIQAKLKQASATDPKAFEAGSGAMLAPLNVLIDSPKTPKEDLVRFLLFRGDRYYAGKKFAEALADYTRARDAGAQSADLSLQIMKAKAETGDAVGAASELDRQIGVETAAGRKVPEAWYHYVISKLYKYKFDAEAVTWSANIVKVYPSPANWRQWVRVYMATLPATVKLDRSQRADLFRLLRIGKSLIDQNDYDEYAQATDDLGLHAETKAVIAEGKANGRIPADDKLAASLAASAATGLSLEKSGDAAEKAAKLAKTGDASAQVGDVYLANGNFAKAVELYKDALSKPFDQPGSAATKRRYLTTDEVNTHYGIALAQSGDKDAAKQAFAQVKGSPRAAIAKFWLTWLDVGVTG